MRAFLLVALLSCGGSHGTATPATNAAAPTTATPAPTYPVEDVALAFARAAVAGDRAKALSLAATFDQIRAMTERDPKDWDAAIADVLDDLAREGKEHSFTVTRAEVKETRTLPADGKHERDLPVAYVQIFIKDDVVERPAGPVWLFVHTDAGWRFSPR